MPGVDQAVILAAGAGSRLRAHAPVKPLVDVGGRSLLHHLLDALAGHVASAVVVAGHGADEVAAEAACHPLPTRIVVNPDWERVPNGVSLLAAAPAITGPFLLAMADHLVTAGLVGRVAAAASDAEIMLGIDRRLGHPWVDEADVTRVRTRSDRIVAIGKTLAIYDAYDTGVFRVASSFLARLDALSAPSLSDGVTAAARAGHASAVDIGSERWLDVDDGRALRLARGAWREGLCA